MRVATQAPSGNAGSGSYMPAHQTTTPNSDADRSTDTQGANSGGGWHPGPPVEVRSRSPAREVYHIALTAVQAGEMAVPLEATPHNVKVRHIIWVALSCAGSSAPLQHTDDPLQKGKPAYGCI